MKDKITKQAVESLNPGTKDHFLWDTELPMFGCKITPKGRRVYLLQYRINGRSRRYTIGIHGALTDREARKIAKKLLHDIALGRDPVDMKKKNKGDQAEGKNQNSSQGRKQQVVKFKTPHIRGNPRKSATKANKASPGPPKPVVNKTKSISSLEKPGQSPP